MEHILIVEDYEDLSEIMQFYLLSHKKYQVTTVRSAEAALNICTVQKFDLILLDVMLPKMGGLEFCQCIRKTSFCPIIFISCLSDDKTIVRALDMGGDDYLVKPFNAAVLVARIEANLRRSRIKHNSEKTICINNLILDTQNCSLTKNGEEICLSPTEYSILAYLFANRGRHIPFDELYNAVWQRPSLGDLRSLFVHINHLRLKIEDDAAKPYYIQTKLRNGYYIPNE